MDQAVIEIKSEGAGARIFAALADGPKTLAVLAKELGLSADYVRRCIYWHSFDGRRAFTWTELPEPGRPYLYSRAAGVTIVTDAAARGRPTCGACKFFTNEAPNDFEGAKYSGRRGGWCRLFDPTFGDPKRQQVMWLLAAPPMSSSRHFRPKPFRRIGNPETPVTCAAAEPRRAQ